MLLLVLSCLTLAPALCSAEGVNITNKVRFPYGGPFMGLFVAFAVPLDLEDLSVYFSLNFEGNYVLPSNESFFDYPMLVEARDFGLKRAEVYYMAEQKLISHGYDKSCLLRAICEASVHSLEGTGVFADLLHIILMPSTSKSENLSRYDQAENYGKSYKHCRKYKKKCAFSILDLISWIGNY